jgi:hypothetical protein
MSKSNLINFFASFDFGVANGAHIHEDGTRVAVLVVMTRLKVAILLTVSTVSAGS